MPSTSTNVMALRSTPVGAIGMGDTGVAAIIVPESTGGVR